jgi:hypothetical protein
MSFATRKSVSANLKCVLKPGSHGGESALLTMMLMCSVDVNAVLF